MKVESQDSHCESENVVSMFEGSEGRKNSCVKMNNVTHFRLLLSKKSVERVNGKNKENLKKCLTALDPGVVVQIPECTPLITCQDRILMVSCKSDDVPTIIRQLAPNIFSGQEGSEKELLLLVPTDQAGCLVGSGGVTIDQLRRSSSCKVKMFKDTLPLSDEQVFCVPGNTDMLDNMITALLEALKLLNTHPLNHEIIHYNPAIVCEGDFVNRDCGGYTKARLDRGDLNSSSLHFKEQYNSMPTVSTTGKDYRTIKTEDIIHISSPSDEEETSENCTIEAGYIKKGHKTICSKNEIICISSSDEVSSDSGYVNDYVNVDEKKRKAVVDRAPEPENKTTGDCTRQLKKNRILEEMKNLKAKICIKRMKVKNCKRSVFSRSSFRNCQDSHSDSSSCDEEASSTDSSSMSSSYASESSGSSDEQSLNSNLKYNQIRDECYTNILHNQLTSTPTNTKMVPILALIPVDQLPNFERNLNILGAHSGIPKTSSSKKTRHKKNKRLKNKHRVILSNT